MERCSFENIGRPLRKIGFHPRALLLAALAATAGTLLGGCGSSSPKVSASQLLSKAKATADAATAVHFKLTSSNVSGTGNKIVGGSGDLVRPNSMQGTFEVTVSSFTANVKVVSVGGVFMAEAPFSSSYQKTDPASYGLTDPAQLLDPATGLTNLLTLAQNPTSGSGQRINGELLDTVSYSVPGRAIPVLPDENPSMPVALTAAIDPATHQLRSVTLVGPFTSATSNSTYTVTLTSYDEHVTITLPAAS